MGWNWFQGALEPYKTQSHTYVSSVRGHHPDESEYFSNISLEVTQFPRSGITSFKLYYFSDGKTLRLQKRLELEPKYYENDLTELSAQQSFQTLEDDIPSLVFGARSDGVGSSNASRYFDIGTKLKLSGRLIYGQHPFLTIEKRK